MSNACRVELIAASVRDIQCRVCRIVSLHCNRNASYVLCESSLTQPLRYAAYCCWIKQAQMPLATKSRVCPCEWGPRRVQCWLLVARTFVVNYACRRSHWPCPMQTCGIAWRSVGWVSHHCSTLSLAVDGYRLQTLSFPTNSIYNALEFQARPVFQVGYHVRTATAVLCSFGIWLISHCREN